MSLIKKIRDNKFLSLFTFIGIPVIEKHGIVEAGKDYVWFDCESFEESEANLKETLTFSILYLIVSSEEFVYNKI